MNRLRLLLVSSLLLLALGSGFAPWVYRPPVALQLTPPGLAEYVKFLHEVRFGLLAVQRLHFLLPLTVVALTTPLLAVNRQLGLPWGLNWLLRLAVVPMALNLLSPVWAPARLIDPEFRLQTIVALLCLALAAFAFLFDRLPLRWLLTVTALLVLAALGLALRQFYLVNEAIAATYASPIHLGWGGWVTVAGSGGLLGAAGWVWRLPRPGPGQAESAGS